MFDDFFRVLRNLFKLNFEYFISYEQFNSEI